MTLHTKLSIAKSAARLVGFVMLAINLVAAAYILGLAEIVGILEELPGTYKGTKTTEG